MLLYANSHHSQRRGMTNLGWLDGSRGMLQLRREQYNLPWRRQLCIPSLCRLPCELGTWPLICGIWMVLGNGHGYSPKESSSPWLQGGQDLTNNNDSCCMAGLFSPQPHDKNDFECLKSTKGTGCLSPVIRMVPCWLGEAVCKKRKKKQAGKEVCVRKFPWGSSGKGPPWIFLEKQNQAIC